MARPKNTSGYRPGGLIPRPEYPGDVEPIGPQYEGPVNWADPYGPALPRDITIPGVPGHAPWSVLGDPTYISRAAGIHGARNVRLSQALLNLGYLPSGVSAEFVPAQASIDQANRAGMTLASLIGQHLGRSGFAGSGQVGYETERGANDFLAYLAAQNEAEAGDVFNLGQSLTQNMTQLNPEAFQNVPDVPARTAHWNSASGDYVDAAGNHYDQNGVRK